MNGEDILPRELTNPVPRRGKWTAEEERYTEKIIFDFEHGTLDVPEGTTLRTLLSKVLNCDPMRITKKYTGNCSIGKRTFVPLVRTAENAIFMDMSQQDLRELRLVWISKLLLMEQWNNRKINLMKAHMGMGMGNIYTDHLNNTINRDHHSIGLPSASSSAGAGGANGLLASGGGANPLPLLGPLSSTYSAVVPGSITGEGSSASGSSANHASTSTSGSAGASAGGSNSSTTTSTTGARDAPPQFEELTLRLILEPYVTSAAEMDYLIKWLKTLFYVLVDRTISTADLEHSMFVGSISLPALIAIFRSRCVENNPRLSQVHLAIEAYLRQLRISIPALQSFPMPRPSQETSAPAASRVETAYVTDSSDGDAAAGMSSEQKEDARAAPRTQGTLSSGSAPSVTEGLLLTSLSSLQPVPLPVLSATAAVTSARPSSASNASTTGAGAVAAGSRPDGSVSAPEIDSTIRHQSVFSQLPDHLKAYLTEVNKVAESSKQQAPPSGDGTSTSTSAGAEENTGAKSGYEPTAAGHNAVADARYSAELQALSFAQQQARAIATAQASAKALAESYRYPLPRRDVPPPQTVQGVVKAEADNKAATADALATEMQATENTDDEDDHLLQYHKALVQSLAAKKSAAALNLSRQQAVQQMQPQRGKPNARHAPSAPVPSPAVAASLQQSQKRRKLADYRDLYMSAMYHQQQDLEQAEGATEAHPPNAGGTVYPSYEKEYSDHQMRMAAEDAAADEEEVQEHEQEQNEEHEQEREEHEQEREKKQSSYAPPTQQQLSLLTAMKDLYPPAVPAASPQPKFPVTSSSNSTSTAPVENRAGTWLGGTGGGSNSTSNLPASTTYAQSKPSRSSSVGSSVPGPGSGHLPGHPAGHSGHTSGHPTGHPSGLPGSSPLMPPFPYSMHPGAMDPYAYQLQQMYAGAWPYAMPTQAYLGQQPGMLPQMSPAAQQNGPPGLPGVSHAQIQQYLAGLSGNYTGDATPSPYAPPAPSKTQQDFATAAAAAQLQHHIQQQQQQQQAAQDFSAAAAIAPGGGGGAKLTLDEWLRAMQQQTTRGMDPGMSLTSSAVLNATRQGYPGLPGYHPGMYPGDPNHLLMLSALSNQGRYPPPAGYPANPAMFRQHPGLHPYLPQMRPGGPASAYSGSSGEGTGGGYTPSAAEMLNYNALLNAALPIPLPAGYREQMAAQALSAAAAGAAGGGNGLGDTSNRAARAGSVADGNTSSGSGNGAGAGAAMAAGSKEDAEGGAGGHSAAAEALMRLLNN